MQELRVNSTIHDAMVSAQGGFHNLLRLETLFIVGRDEGWHDGAESKDGRLRRVDDGREMGNSHHTHIRDGERTTL